MHCLSGTYLKEISDEMLAESNDSSTNHQFYPVKIAIPPNKSRIVYFYTQGEQTLWVQRLQQAMGYSNVFDYYELEKTLGKG